MNEIVKHLPDLLTFRPLFYGTLMWSVFIFAFMRGGWEERAAISATVIGAYLAFGLVSIFGLSPRVVALTLALPDCALLGVFLVISCRSRKFWPLWLAALQGPPLLTHLAPFMPGMLSEAYNQAFRIWSYPQLAVIAMGIVQHHNIERARKLHQVAEASHQPADE